MGPRRAAQDLEGLRKVAELLLAVGELDQQAGLARREGQGLQNQPPRLLKRAATACAHGPGEQAVDLIRRGTRHRPQCNAAGSV